MGKWLDLARKTGNLTRPLEETEEVIDGFTEQAYKDESFSKNPGAIRMFEALIDKIRLEEATKEGKQLWLRKPEDIRPGDKGEVYHLERRNSVPSRQTDSTENKESKIEKLLSPFKNWGKSKDQ